MRSSSLYRLVGWTLAGNVAFGFSQWGITIAVAKLGHEGMVGELALAWAVTTPVFVFSTLQLRQLLVSASDDEVSFRDYLTARRLLTTGALVATILIVLALGYRGERLAVMVAVGVAKALDSLVDIHLGWLQRQERMDRVAKALFVNGAMALGAAAAAMSVWRHASIAALASGLGPLAALVVVSRWNAGEPRWSAKGSGLRGVIALATLGLPLGVVMGLVAVQTNLPRLFVDRHLGISALGIFAAASQLTNVGANLVSSIATATVRRIARAFSSGEVADFRRITWRLFGLGLGIGLAGAALSFLAGRQILSIVYTPDYAQGASVLVSLSIAAGLSYGASFLGYSMTMARRLRIQVILFLFAAAVTWGGCALAVPVLGLHGAALGAGIGSVAQILGSAAVLRSAERSLTRAQSLPPEEPTSGGQRSSASIDPS
ncbi:lipopolysaccharide biosynthesis protein [Anaeromyxobacter soli]|uniref:lipopolysaccharide biosynthesis protein n=1 Tax=Anaeromyxobacter soli TaxID=2922725 RepID=UPI001FAF7F15|nr:lipopolysaccharide biosynthesis protein [Anaeromyxobacter sp. SG29]